MEPVVSDASYVVGAARSSGARASWSKNSDIWQLASTRPAAKIKSHLRCTDALAQGYSREAWLGNLVADMVAGIAAERSQPDKAYQMYVSRHEMIAHVVLRRAAWIEAHRMRSPPSLVEMPPVFTPPPAPDPCTLAADVLREWRSLGHSALLSGGCVRCAACAGFLSRATICSKVPLPRCTARPKDDARQDLHGSRSRKRAVSSAGNDASSVAAPGPTFGSHTPSVPVAVRTDAQASGSRDGGTAVASPGPAETFSSKAGPAETFSSKTDPVEQFSSKTDPAAKFSSKTDSCPQACHDLDDPEAANIEEPVDDDPFLAPPPALTSAEFYGGLGPPARNGFEQASGPVSTRRQLGPPRGKQLST